MTAYYNEIDPYAAQWLRNLIDAGHIVPGEVDTRSIEDVRPGDLAGFTQCHFFAGIGVWSYALRRAGWPDDRRVWTGSCPCQPFSAAGKGAGMADERHLWPAWFHLISACRPDRIYGEQVASKDGLAWLDLVLADVENANYAGRAFDLCAAGVGAPHIRQRLYWMADAATAGFQGGEQSGERFDAQRATSERGRAFGDVGQSEGERQGRRFGEVPSETTANQRSLARQGDGDAAGHSGATSIVEHAESDGWQQRRPESSGRGVVGGRSDGGVANSNGRHASAEREQRSGEQRQQSEDGISSVVAHDDDRCEGQPSLRLRGPNIHDVDRRGPVGGFWAAAEWIACRDGKARPVEPGTFPLVNGAPARVGRLRGYGNAIVAPLAEEFIRATM